jgi:hypothetical protein
MGTGRTLNKHPRTRPIKSQGEKRRRTKAQRARLVKFGLDVTTVAKMLIEEVRKLVQKPVLVKKIVARKSAAPKTADGTVGEGVAPKAKKTTAKKPVAAKTEAKKPAVRKPVAKKPVAKKKEVAE